MKLAFFETPQADKQQLTELLKVLNLDAGSVVFFTEKLDSQMAEKIKDFEVVSVFINSVVNKEIIDTLPNLKLINTSSTGFDHIDVAYAASKNILVTNVPAYGSRTVAEFAFALILGLSRKTFLAYRQVKENHNYDISHFEGFNLQGKTLGIVGTGRIGQNVAQIAKGFDMTIVGFDAYPNAELATKLGFTYVPLDQLLAESDVITLHVPYNKDTHHLINLDNVKKIKPGALFINTSRGEVADNEALVYALDNKIISALGLDVIEGEKMLIDETKAISGQHQGELKTLIEDHILLDRPEVAYTPHIAFFSREAKHEILQTTVNNIKGFIEGKPIDMVKS